MSVLLFYALSTRVVLNQFQHFHSCAGLKVWMWKGKMSCIKWWMCVARLWVKYNTLKYEHHVVRKARVIVDDNSHVIAKYYVLLPSGRQFHILKSNTVNSISEQIMLFKHQNSVCMCVCKLLVCLLCNFCKKIKIKYIIISKNSYWNTNVEY